MAREFGAVNVTIWQDANFRALPWIAQDLYLTLWTHPDLSYCGIVDYRPGRIAKLADGLTAEIVEAAAACLEARHFLVIDRESEEALIRSWMKWDGLMKQPRLAVSMVKAYASTASNLLRSVVVHELHKVRDGQPDLACWGNPKVADVLRQPAQDAKDLPAVSDPLGDRFTQEFGQWFTHRFGQRSDETSLSVSVPVSVPPTPSPSPSPLHQRDTDASASAPRGTRLDPDWMPDPKVVQQMRDERPGVDLAGEHRKFIDYWAAKTGRDATKLDWNATWRNWIRNAKAAPTSQSRDMDTLARAAQRLGIEESA